MKKLLVSIAASVALLVGAGAGIEPVKDLGVVGSNNTQESGISIKKKDPGVISSNTIQESGISIKKKDPGVIS